MEKITHSRLASFRACPRKHYFAYELGRRSIKESPALAFGTAFHKAVRAYWEARSCEEPIDASCDAQNVVTADPLANETDQAKLYALVTGYCAVWNTIAVKPLHVEQPFAVALRHPKMHAASKYAELGGQVDLIAYVNGKLCLIEHKTTSTPVTTESDYALRLATDSQIAIYYEAISQLGLEIHDVIYDVAVKPAIRISESKGESLESFQDRCMKEVLGNVGRYFVQIHIPRPSSEQDLTRFDVWEWSKRIAQSRKENSWPRNTDACFGKYGVCEYWGVCSGSASIDDDTQFVTKGAHAELAGEESRTLRVKG